MKKYICIRTIPDHREKYCITEGLIYDIKFEENNTFSVYHKDFYFGYISTESYFNEHFKYHPVRKFKLKRILE